MDEYFPTQRIALWRTEYAYLTFEEKYAEFRGKNQYHNEMEELFGVVFYNPPLVCDKPLYSLLDYTHNINRYWLINKDNFL